MSTVKVSVVIPCYHAAPTIGELCDRVRAAMEAKGWSFEVVLVDDRGNPGDWEVIQGLSAKHSFARGMQLAVNAGQHAATLAGLAASRGEVVVTCDEDLQHPPEVIHELVGALENADLVYGVSKHLPHSWWRNATSRGAKRLVGWMCGSDRIMHFSSFRAMRGDLARLMAESAFPGFYLDILSQRYFARAKAVAVDLGRDDRESGYTLGKLLSHAVRLLLTATHRPLRLAGMVSLGTLVVTSLLTAYVLVQKYIYGVPVQGWTSLMITILFLATINFFVIGVICEYLIGGLATLRGQRPYVVAKESGS